MTNVTAGAASGPLTIARFMTPVNSNVDSVGRGLRKEAPASCSLGSCRPLLEGVWIG